MKLMKLLLMKVNEIIQASMNKILIYFYSKNAH